ncbi:conserved exported hypothetical protein [Xenorhabdus innexi]|uniref:Uncharacterized protein n=2 Tax=Xenorhabdus innexi TaxID=290109 RepID=A0A1N6MYZ7_9GAMM|nr:hypothetical protein Xinn_03455 [Xenorhabdus innexi]SIP74065.1 conserved exported hypothetical protein [Xenorhabdus innexi]
MVDNMKKIIMSCVVFFCLHGVSWASKNTIPKDLQEYIKNTEDCEYLAGEWDSDLPDERKRLIEDEVNIYCKKAHESFYELKAKYKNDPKKIKIINEHSEMIKDYDDTPVE